MRENTLYIEPATASGEPNSGYWAAVDEDPDMIVCVESQGQRPQVFCFRTVARARDYIDTTPDELSHLVYARQLDEPGFGEVPREEMT